MRHVHGDFFCDVRMDGYHVYVNGCWRFVGAEQLAKKNITMGGVHNNTPALKDALLKIADEDNMARKEIKIEIVADLENDQFDAVLEAARDAARTVLTMAMVVTTKNKKPTVKVVSSDFMSGEREWTIDTEEVT